MMMGETHRPTTPGLNVVFTSHPWLIQTAFPLLTTRHDPSLFFPLFLDTKNKGRPVSETCVDTYP